MKRLLALIGSSVLVVSALFASPALVSPASAAVPTNGNLVSADPADFTPHVLDGRVNSIVQVGGTMVLGGSFTRTRNSTSATEIARANLVAFNASTGQITSFAPNPNGTINVVIPAGDGQSVYVGGSFTSIAGQAAKNVARVRVSDGALVPGFNGGSPTGVVKDLRLAGGRLWVAGAFTHISGKRQPALATINPSTGAFDPFMGLAVEGLHNGGYTTVGKIDVDPATSRLVGVGNFDMVGGSKNHQAFMLDISGPNAALANFQTSFYETPCSQSFDSYMRDVDFSPDGTFFVISTTGAYGGPDVACDTTARFEKSSAGTGLAPSWVDATGGDTTYGVEITDNAVYVGGHQRWQNNPYAGDTPGPGAVARPGIAALDPQNGLPMSWNPTRNRGVGVFDFLVTDQGLWVGSDTERIGAFEYHGRIALMPANGTAVPRVTTPGLPNEIYQAGTLGSASDPRVLYRVNAAGPELSATKGIDWAADTDASPSQYHNGGNNRAGWGTVGSVDSTLPAGTPVDLFSSELWDGGEGEEMHWGFPVPAGTRVQVRLYFANQCSCTDDPGERRFSVAVDGSTVLPDFDIVAAAGHNRATMRAFDVTSDGNVDIDFGHIVENPLINGIEVINLDLPESPSTAGSLTKRSYNAGTVGPSASAPAGGIDWNQARGAFMVNGQLYLALADGSFSRRSFDGTGFGGPAAVDTADQLVPLAAWRSDASQATGMFLDEGRLYYTRAGSSSLYYRYFTPESGVVGAKQLVASGNVDGIDFSKVKGMFSTGEKLFWATADGNLHRIDWQRGALHGQPDAGTHTVVSGPAVDGNAWASRAMFLFQNADGNGAGLPPAASFDSQCDSLTCAFDSTESTAPGGTISSYAWSFGDGATSTAANPSHTYAANGKYTVTLTVTTQAGASATTTRLITVTRVNKAPTAEFDVTCDQLVCAFDASSSTDPDGEIASYGWKIGTATAQGVTTQHTFAAAGTYPVTLTVTDNEGAQRQLSRDVQVTTAPAPALGHVAAASTNGNRSVHTVAIPAAVQAGDQLIATLNVNSSTATVTPPAGWTEIASADADGFRTRAWARTAVASDAGSTLTAATSALAKSAFTVAAYRSNTGKATVVEAKVSSSSAVASATSPSVSGVAGGWLVTSWGVKSSNALSWQLPAGSSARSMSTGSGGGAVSDALVDSGGALATGPAGGLTATFGAQVSRAATISLVLKAVP